MKVKQVIGPRVILKAISDKKEEGFLKDFSTKPPIKGEVLEVGDTKKVQVGDIVVFPDLAGTKVEIDGAEYLILNESEIYFIQ